MFDDKDQQFKKPYDFDSAETGPQAAPPTSSSTGGPSIAQNPNASAAAAAPFMSHWAEPPSTAEKESVKNDTGDTTAKAEEAEKVKAPGYPKVIEICGEKVNVANEAEEKEAKEIITKLKDEYGVEVSSLAGIEAIKAQYDKVPEAVTKQLKAKQWEMKELRAVAKALAHFAPILGKNRENSSRKDTDQEVTSVSKVDQAIDQNNASGTLDTTTLGEYFKGKKNFGMFSAGTDLMGSPSIGVFKDNETNLEANATHELAHGLLRHKLDDFVKESGGYWTGLRTKSGAADAEAPITEYGQTSASEDLSETAKYYFIEPKTLETKCPKRYAFIKKEVESWQPKQAEKP